MVVNRSKIDIHKSRECTKIIITCPKCQLKISRGYYYSQHRKNDIDSDECQKEQIKILTKEKNELLNKNQSLIKENNELKNNLKSQKEKNEELNSKNEQLEKNIINKERELVSLHLIYIFVLLLCFMINIRNSEN